MYQSPEPPNELLACFDEQGNSIEPQLRKVVHEEPLKFWHGVVNIWLVNKQENLLCTKRSETLSGNPGKWQTYLGGHVKAGKMFKEAAVLELDEEVDLPVNPADLFLAEKGKKKEAKHFFESYAYLFNGSIDELTFNDGEIVEAKWISMDEYNKNREAHSEQWCNSCSAENQEKIKEWLASL